MQLTIRRVDPEWVKLAKRKAARKGVSINQFLLDALQRADGTPAAQEKKRNLDKCNHSGTQPDAFKKPLKVCQPLSGAG